jgi:hypothetical protein
MLNAQNVLNPSVGGPGLNLSISPALLLLSTGSLFSVPFTVVGLTANATNFVWVNLSTGSIQANTSGFPANVFPVATVTTSTGAVLSVTDNRPDFYLSAQGGGSSINFSDSETPSGTINGINTAFTLAAAPNPALSLIFTVNGVVQKAGGVDYTLAGSTITLVTAPQTGDVLLAWYRH